MKSKYGSLLNKPLILFAVMAMTCAGFAKTCTWKGGGGDWNVAGNWEEGAVPEDGDTVVLTGTAAVIFNGEVEIDEATVL